jgi:hypothetical protein
MLIIYENFVLIILRNKMVFCMYDDIFFPSVDSHEYGGTPNIEHVPIRKALLSFTTALATNYAVCTNNRFEIEVPYMSLQANY